MKKTTIGLTLFPPITPRFWANIGIKYSKSAVMRTESLWNTKEKLCE